MKKPKNKSKILVSLLLAFGLFTNLHSDTNANSIESSKLVIEKFGDETIDGKH